MITIHDKTEKTFDTIGLGVLSPSYCTISEELNGLYELELEQYYDAKGMWQYLALENIVAAPTPMGIQPFRIYRVNPNMEAVHIYARHVFYDLLDNVILECDLNALSAEEALQAIDTSLELKQGFTFDTDIAHTMPGHFTLNKINAVEALIGSYTKGAPDEKTQYENRSFISMYRGEIVRDGFHISFLEKRGKDRGFEIRYGKNLTALQVDEDYSDIVTRIYPFGRNGEKYSKKYVDSKRVKDYLYPKSIVIVFSGLEEYTDSLLEIGADQIFYFDQPDIPKVNIKVDFEMLSNLECYERYQYLEKLYLGDTIKVVNEKMRFEATSKVIAYQWDAIVQKYNSIEMGSLKNSLIDYIQGGGFVPSNGTIVS